MRNGGLLQLQIHCCTAAMTTISIEGDNDRRKKHDLPIN
jgi:hypothetical protein